MPPAVELDSLEPPTVRAPGCVVYVGLPDDRGSQVGR
jgi:hypothetical protein